MRQLGYLARGAPGQARSSPSSTPGPTSTPATSICASAPQAVKRGVWQAGGFPLEFPVSTLSRDVPEADPDALPQPARDGDRGAAAVLPGRRRPCCWAAATSRRPRCSWAPRRADLPAVFVPAGPMLPGHWRDETLGSGTDMWKYWDEHRAGLIGDCELRRAGGRPRPLARSLHDHGHGLHDDRRRRGPRRDAAGRLLASRPSTPGTSGWPPPSGRRIVELVHRTGQAVARSSPARPSRTPSPRCSASAAPPTPSST